MGPDLSTDSVWTTAESSALTLQVLLSAGTFGSEANIVHSTLPLRIVLLCQKGPAKQTLNFP